MVDFTYSGTPPNLSQSQPDFDENTQYFVDYVSTLGGKIEEWAGATLQSTTTTSTTSNSIGTGSKTFTVEAGKGFVVGMGVRCANSGSAFMDGIVTSYSGTSLTVDVTAPPTGTGTFTSWTIFQSVTSGASLGANTFTGAQTVPDEAYSASGWDGNNTVPTKNAVRDKIQSLDLYTPDLFNITAVNSSNTLVITRPATVDSPAKTTYRNATLANGGIVTVTNTTDQTLTVPQGATLGSFNGAFTRFLVLEVLNADNTTDQLAITFMDFPFIFLDETNLISTTAISAGSTSRGVIYSTTAVTNRPYRIIGYIEGTWATAGTYSIAPSKVQATGGYETVVKSAIWNASNSIGYTNGTRITVAHGLGRVPYESIVLLQCSNPQANYVSGDQIVLTTWATSSTGQAFYFDATNLYFIAGSSGINVPNATTGASTILTASNFTVRFYWR